MLNRDVVRPSMRHGVGLLVAAAVGLTILTSPLIALADEPAPWPALAQQVARAVTVTRDGWIHYNDLLLSELALESSETRTVSGMHTPDGCSIDGLGPASPSRAPIYTEEIAYNPDTCQEIVVSGDLSPVGLAKARALSTTVSLPATRDGPASSPAQSASTVRPATYAISTHRRALFARKRGGSVRAHVAWRKQQEEREAEEETTFQTAYNKTFWIDPLFITITSLTVNLTWPLEGGVGKKHATAFSYEFPFDSWSNSGIHGPNIGPVSGGWRAGASESFFNSDFEELLEDVLGEPLTFALCGFSHARAHFQHDVRVYGYSNGTYLPWSDDRVAGGCSNLVHHSERSGFGEETS